MLDKVFPNSPITKQRDLIFACIEKGFSVATYCKDVVVRHRTPDRSVCNFWTFRIKFYFVSSYRSLEAL